MLRRSQIEPFLKHADGRLEIIFLEDAGGKPDGAVAALLDQLARLVVRLEGRAEATVREALRRQERRVRDHRRLAGIAKTLLDLCEFRPPEGAALAPRVREAVFRARGRRWPPLPADREQPFRDAARELHLPPDRLSDLLYADRPERRILLRAPRMTGRDLLARYNLELARGALYDARRLTVQAKAGWRDLHRAVKRCRLMYSLSRSGSGFALDITGPAAAFVSRPQLYGIRLARVVPAVVRAPGWRLVAEVRRSVRGGPPGPEGTAAVRSAAPAVQPRHAAADGDRWLPLELDASVGPLRAAPRAERFDSGWERDLAEEFAQKFGGQERTGWRLERESTPVDIDGQLLLPDFTLRHADGREALVEILGFWTPEYLSTKVAKLQRAALSNLILVAYEALALAEPAARALPGPVLAFKTKPRIAEIIELAERVALAPFDSRPPRS